MSQEGGLKYSPGISRVVEERWNKSVSWVIIFEESHINSVVLWAWDVSKKNLFSFSF